MLTRGEVSSPEIGVSLEGPSYLLRFDDICPTMNWTTWNRIEKVLLAQQIRPILAVVPDNQDPKLVIERPVSDFWQRVREWQARKWSIALHGYQHRYVNSNGGLLRLSGKSEFAGLPGNEQEAKLRAGLAKFAEEGVHADAWIAPSHSFDETTVRLLPELGIRVISDGLTVLPFECGNGLTWVPQQLWRFEWRKRGVWTICFHHNEWDEPLWEEFCAGVKAFRSRMSSLDEVLSRWAGRAPDMRDRVHEAFFKSKTWLLQRRLLQRILRFRSTAAKGQARP